MNVERLRRAGASRRTTQEAAKRAYARALDVVVEELAAGEDVDVARAAKLAGVSRQTVYNELERRGAEG